MIEYLISHGFNIEESSPDTPSPLNTAIIENKFDIVKLLLEKGADPTECGDQTPVSYAVNADNTEILELLLKSDAPPSPMLCKISPLIMAIRSNKLEIVKLLLKYGVDPNNSQKSKVGKKIFAVSVALTHKSYNSFILLVMCGAKTDKIQGKKIPRSIIRAARKFNLPPIKKGKHPYAVQISNLYENISDYSDEIQQIKIKTTRNADFSDLNFKENLEFVNSIYKKAITLVEKIIILNNKLKALRSPVIAEQLQLYETFIGANQIDKLDLTEYFNSESLEIIKTNRRKLYELGISISRMNSVISYAYDVFERLKSYTDEFHQLILKTIDVTEEKLTKTVNDQALLLRAGLSSPQCQILLESLPYRIKVLQRQKEPVEQSQQKLAKMSIDMCKAMRQCYK